VPRAKQRTPQLRKQLLAVAAEVLAREGVAGFTTRGVASAASTSPPAIYELFGDRGGLLREVFFEGFRGLLAELASLQPTADPLADLRALADRYRGFVKHNPVLAQMMFSQPFSDFDPTADDLRAGAAVRRLIVASVRRCIDARLLAGDETDIAHVLVALTQGMAAAENARRLGRSRASIDRRWELAVQALLDGLGARGADAIGVR
jgi:AcrR family transcriptional regulator